MGYITDVQLNKHKKRVSIFVDHAFSFSIDREVAVFSGLHTGAELPQDKIEELRHNDSVQRCLNVALHFLAYRPRSESEVRRRLRRDRFSEEIIREVVARLKKQSLIDDVAFANYWKDNRVSYRPRSKRLIKRELMEKGITSEIATNVVDDVDDEESAYRVAQKKARTIEASDYNEFRNRLSNSLRLKGFHFDTIHRIAARLWQEKYNT
jgi:regulatory protein